MVSCAESRSSFVTFASGRNCFMENLKKPDRVKPRSGAEERKYGQVAVRIRGGEHIQAIAEIPTLPVGVPANVAVRL